MNHRGKPGSQEQLVTRTFDEKADTYAQGYTGESATAHSFTIRLQRVYEMIGDRAAGRVLDIGCGPGITVEHLVTRGFEVYGVDISAEMVRECQKQFGHMPAAHFSTGNIEALEFQDAFFDVVLSMGVVEYVDDDAVAVKEMVRVTKPGGVIVVTLPNRVSPYRVWQRTVYRGLRAALGTIRGRRPPAEISHREYTRASYSRLLQSCGLTIADTVYYNFSLFVFPLDRMFPGLAVRASRAMERFGRGALGWLGTGFIVRAEKPRSLPA
jgi:2-polyprenyl-3-methyl-5-hydroxy-6-metoxy-1,4-benzoquinol methylase